MIDPFPPRYGARDQRRSRTEAELPASSEGDRVADERFACSRASIGNIAMTTPLRRALADPKVWIQTLVTLAVIWVIGWFLTGTISGAVTVVVLVALFGLCGVLYT